MSFLKRSASLVAVAGMALGGLLAVSPVAHAAGALPPAVPGLTFTPASGSAASGNPELRTGGPCPEAADNYFASIFGGALPDDGILLIDPGQVGLSKTAAFGILTSYSLRDAFVNAGVPYAAGEYVVEFVCADFLATKLATWTTPLTLTGGASGAATYATPVQQVASTTTLTATPTSTTQGESVTLTATVTRSSGSGTPTGTVTFKNGATTLGTGELNASGVATLATTMLPSGTNANITAVYEGAGGVASSTSAAASVTVAAAPNPTSTTSLAVTPLAGPAGNRVLTATVATSSGGSSAGTVQFLNGATVLGTSPVVSGSASLTKYFAAGEASLTAKFIPAAANNTLGSTSDAVTFTVTAAAGPAPDEQTITGEIPAGSIVITTPYTPASPLNLGVLALNPGATLFSASADFENIQITDTRAGDQSWTANAQAANLSNGGAGVINGQNVGLTALAATYLPGNGLQAGDVLTFDNAAATGVSPTDAGSAGLGGVAHKFASAANGVGTVTLKGLLTLNAPTSTPAGTYVGTVTFTVS